MREIIEVAIANKKKMLKELQSEIRALNRELYEIKKEEEIRRKHSREIESKMILEAANVADEFKRLSEVGLNDREIVSLYGISQNWKLKDLAKSLGLSPAWSRQIREKALRKLRHLDDLELDKSLGFNVCWKLYGDDWMFEQVGKLSSARKTEPKMAENGRK